MQSVRCPLCAKTFVVSSEQECEAHIASCVAFHQRFSGDRAGLVSGLSEAASATTSATPPPSNVAALDAACAALAGLLRPLVPVARDGKSVEETHEMLVHLVSAILSAADDDDDFGLDELLTVTLDPYLMQLADGRALRAALPQAFETVRRAPRMSVSSVSELLLAALARPECGRGCGGA